MAKRFIDTEIFDDPWFSDLSKDAKILWIYLITKCSHAGIFKKNEKLTVFQTGTKGLATVSKELGNRLIVLNDELLFIPKFIKFILIEHFVVRDLFYVQLMMKIISFFMMAIILHL